MSSYINLSLSSQKRRSTPRVKNTVCIEIIYSLRLTPDQIMGVKTILFSVILLHAFSATFNGKYISALCMTQVCLLMEFNSGVV